MATFEACQTKNIYSRIFQRHALAAVIIYRVPACVAEAMIGKLKVPLFGCDAD